MQRIQHIVCDVVAEPLRDMVPGIVQVGFGQRGKDVVPVQSSPRRLFVAARCLARAAASSPSTSSLRLACVMPSSTWARMVASRASLAFSSCSRSRRPARTTSVAELTPTLDLAPDELLELFSQRNIHWAPLQTDASRGPKCTACGCDAVPELDHIKLVLVSGSSPAGRRSVAARSDSHSAAENASPAGRGAVRCSPCPYGPRTACAPPRCSSFQALRRRSGPARGGGGHRPPG